MQNKIKITLAFLLFSFTAFAKSPDSAAIATLQKQVDALQKTLKTLKSQQTGFSKQLSTADAKIENLQSQLESQKQTIAVLADSLGVKIEKTVQTANIQIAGVNKSVGKKSLFAIAGGVLLLLLSIALFVWLFKRQKASSANIIGQLEKTKSTIDEKLVAEFAKNAETMESLLKTLRELPVSAGEGAPDHSLALKLADEITLMERNISLMDAGTKGLKQLNRSIGKLKDNLVANGYEIPELLGKFYNEGMKVIVINSIYDENLEKDVKIISKVIKPQVNYQDKMIQAAQIELNIG